MRKLFLALAALLPLCSPSLAQQAKAPTAMTPGTTFGLSLFGNMPMAFSTATEPGYSNNTMWPLSMTPWGGLRMASVETGSAQSAAGIAPSVAGGGTSLVAKGSPGNLYGLYVYNNGSAAGFLVTINATSAPASGASISQIECRPIAAGGDREISYGSGPAEYYSTGIVALLSTSCTTYTPTNLNALSFKSRVR